jgi:transposase
LSDDLQLKKNICGGSGRMHSGWYDRRVRRVRDLSCGDAPIYLEVEVRRVPCRSCGHVKSEQPEFLPDNPLYTKRFAMHDGQRKRVAHTPTATTTTKDSSSKSSIKRPHRRTGSS